MLVVSFLSVCRLLPLDRGFAGVWFTCASRGVGTMGSTCMQDFVAGAFDSGEDSWEGGGNRLLLIAGL